ncbi:hypothetical protein ACJ73_05525 [Blastomyces percursus]|uniref:Uncharacterized protein n=1 Tax=Blastomyces percursus TaxID=1658174 RepID=A0A1J9Q3M3_9EURO|nr:hypothetical protein ACJ73_05525 [Blastomyces percursus]
MFMDGGVPCLSSRTLILCTMMVKDTAFGRYFLNEEWFWMPLSADDDNSITRWIINGWKMYFQSHPGAEVQTTLECDLKLLKQCIRWFQSNWRRNLRRFLEWATWRILPPLQHSQSHSPVRQQRYVHYMPPSTSANDVSASRASVPPQPIPPPNPGETPPPAQINDGVQNAGKLYLIQPPRECAG